ncbi:MAG: membrane protein insertase YidC [Clostridia bacterium]|nr:membrane protein insertase YidC [Clostridia bacterium]
MVDLIGLLMSAAPTLTNPIGKIIYWMYEGIGNFGWTVVVFTIALKLVLSPLDFWQKAVTRKNNKALKRMKPELEKLKKTFGANQQVMQQKQMELYKKEGYSMLGSCLPTLITLLMFFVIFGGFNAAVKYENQMLVYNLAEVYQVEVIDAGITDVDTMDEIMLDAYNKSKVNQKWLWVENVFMADSWADVVPSVDTYVGSGLGKLNARLPENANFPVPSKYEGSVYNALLGPAIQVYNKTKFFDLKHWNGYLILPLLSVVLSLLSNKLMKGSQPEQPPQYDAQGKEVNTANSMKYMTMLMPVMIGVFAVFYSAAFSIYMFTNSLITVLFNLGYNVITGKVDKKEEEMVLRTTFKR